MLTYFLACSSYFVPSMHVVYVANTANYLHMMNSKRAYKKLLRSYNIILYLSGTTINATERVTGEFCSGSHCLGGPIFTSYQPCKYDFT